jgi:hypothetical protein
LLRRSGKLVKHSAYPRDEVRLLKVNLYLWYGTIAGSDPVFSENLTYMKQKRKWFLSSATDETDLAEIKFKQELLLGGEPIKYVVDFYDGRLIPQPTEGETYLNRSNSVRILVRKVEKETLIFSGHNFKDSEELSIIEFLKLFKIEYNG